MVGFRRRPRFRGRGRRPRWDLEKVQGRYQVVGRSLNTYANALETAQHETVVALYEAQDAQSDLTRYAAPDLGLGPPLGSDLVIGIVSVDEGAQRRRESMHCEAAGRLEAARRRCTMAVEALDEVALTEAKVVRQGADDDLKDGFWDRIKGKIGDHAGFLAGMAQWAGYLATGISVLALALALTVGAPFTLLVLGAVATAIALGGHSALAFEGRGSWVDVGVDLVSLATFGTGALATRASATALRTGTSAASQVAASRASGAVLEQHQTSLQLANWLRESRLPLGPVRTAASGWVTHVGSLADGAGRAASSAVLSRPLPQVGWKERLMFLDRESAQQVRHLNQLADEFPSAAGRVAGRSVAGAGRAGALSTGGGGLADALNYTPALDDWKDAWTTGSLTAPKASG